VSEPQGEAIGFDGFGFGYFTVSEGLHQPVYYSARLSPMPELTISPLGADSYLLSWPEAGFFDLEIATSLDFDNPDIVDVAGLTTYEHDTSATVAFFRLKRR
jgi:hypothetical protein